MRERIIKAIDNIELRDGDSKDVAAAIYLKRLTGIMPVKPTRQGLFKASYNHCVELAEIDMTQGREATLARFEEMVEDYIWVWEHPLLG